MALLTFPIRGDKISLNVEVLEHLFNAKTPFQEIDIFDSEVFGRILLLDGHIQLTTFDEKAYHETLVHIPLLNIPGATSALVVGGGDGGVLREFCADPSLTHVEMVEIDQGVIDASLRYLPELSGTAFEDPRVKLHIGDAFEFVGTKKGAYDLIVVDSTDTYEGEDGALSEALFTEKFYNDCREALKPGGIVVTQADNPVFCPYSLESIEEQFGKVFGTVGSYVGLVPSFGGYSAFCYGRETEPMSGGWPADVAAGRSFSYLNPSTYALAFSGLAFGR